MGRDYLAEYALLDAQEKDIVAKKAAVKLQIIEDMVSKGVSSETHALGKFTVSKLKSWTYPPEVVKLEDETSLKVSHLQDVVKAAQELAKSNETATFTEKESLRFTPVDL